MIRKIIILILIFSFIFSSINKEVEEIINNMTLKEKIAQMIMVRVRSDYYASDNYYKKDIEN